MMDQSTEMGGFKRFFSLFFPVLLIAFSGSLSFLVEKILFGSFSTSVMEAAIAVANIGQVFQLSTVAIAMMSLVFAGQRLGAQDGQSLGPCIWQYIWFALLSTLIVVPIGSLYGMYYLKGTLFHNIVKPYLHLILLINGLYPLGAALSCFYIAQEKTKLVLFSSICTQLLKILFAYLLIPAFAHINPVWGLYGGVISTFLSQVFFIVVLLIGFLSAKNAAQYDTRQFRLQWNLFWKCIHPGLLRAFSRISTTICWASIAYLMVSKTETHILMYSTGAVVFLFLPFLGDALCQTQIVMVAHLLGAKREAALRAAFRPGTICAYICMGIVAIPLLVMPHVTFAHLFPKISMGSWAIRSLFAGVWVSFACFTWSYVPIGYILAFKDMLFSVFMGLFGWLNGFVLMYVLIEKVQIAPQYFWLALSLTLGSNGLMYYLRAKWLCARAVFDVSPIQRA
ncbi:MAG: hypothetical protein KGR16_06955 [Verrucomicrobia bacterium]|nr:hypothetical protein [Verrucomicrobiota bacterium]MDE3046779.1 MATE family efflux transporter [Verrucomicrobiota bacterium]